MVQAEGNKIVQVERTWKSGDVIELLLPMHIFKTKWYENFMAIERGPITYALKIGEQFKKIENTKDAAVYGASYTEVQPTTPWNYGLYDVSDDKLNDYFKAENTGKNTLYPWNQENAPIIIKTKGRRIPSWKLYDDMAGPHPYSHIYGLESEKQEEEITLVPYGCTTLRITQFPLIGKK